MSKNLTCYFLGHKLQIVAPQFEEIASNFTLGGIPRNRHQVRISDGKLQCTNPGCQFEERLWDFDRAQDEAIFAKYSGTFWRSQFWRNFKQTVSSLFWICFWISLLALFLYVFIIWPDQKTCSVLAQEFELETKWRMWTGCMVHSEKFGWIPKEEFFKFLNLNVQ